MYYILYTRIQCVRGGWGSGPQTDKHLPQSPFTGLFSDDDSLHCLLRVYSYIIGNIYGLSAALLTSVVSPVFLQKILRVILTDIKINKFGINVFALSWISSSESFSAFSLKEKLFIS
jgi:hypothetical protein